MKKWALVLLISFILVISGTKLDADVGPKPSLEIRVENMDEPYILDVLIEVSSSVDDYDETSVRSEAEFNHYLESDYPDILLGYQDEEGFASGSFYNNAPLYLRNTDDNIFEISYFNAPQVFKVALMDEDGRLIISEKVEREQFNASFNYDLSGVSFDDATAQGDYEIVEVSSSRLEEDYRGPTSSSTVNIALETLFRLVITLAVELAILYAFTYRQKMTYYITGVTNVVTQGILTLFTLSVFYYWGGPLGGIIVFVLGEAIVFMIEMVVFPVLFKEKPWWIALIYALVANTASLIAGILLFLI